MQSIHEQPQIPAEAGPPLRATGARFGGLWRHPNFMRLWTGQTVSLLGSGITREALPYTAILALHATPAQMGLLGAAGNAPLLLLGLFAGVWVDRMRRRPLMIVADLGRAVLLLSIVVAFLFGQLGIAQLYIVALLAGTLTVFFDIAHQTFLPLIVEREQLVEGNSKLGISDSIAEVSGPPLGGLLVQLVSGPITILLDALSFLVSAVALARIRVAEPRPAGPAVRAHIRHDLLVGLRAIWADPLLRPIALSTTVRHFFGWFFGAIYSLYALRTLGLTPATLGLVVACGGIGSFLGATVVAPATRRLGFGWATCLALVVEGAAGGLTWLAGGIVLAAVPLLVAAQIVGDMGDAAATINTVSLRQTITPEHMLGRVNASMRVLGQGIGTLGMLVGGVLAEVIGLRPTVAVAVLGVIAGNLLLVYSPLRRLRALPPGPAHKPLPEDD